MSKRSLSSRSNIACSTLFPRSALGLLKGKTILCLALPLALVVGCASKPDPSTAHDYTPAPTPVAVSSHEAINQELEDEIIHVFMTSTNDLYNVSVSLNQQGVVTLRGQALNDAQRRRIDSRIGHLPGVTLVRYELTDMPATNTVAASQ